MSACSIGVATTMPQTVATSLAGAQPVPGGGPQHSSSPLLSPVNSPLQIAPGGPAPSTTPLFVTPIAGAGAAAAPPSATTIGTVGASNGALALTAAPAPGVIGVIPTGSVLTPAPQALGAPAPTYIVAPAAVAATPPASAAAPARLTSLGVGGSVQDADLVERALQHLKGSASGAAVVDKLLASGARINVISDQEFSVMGQDGAHAFFDPKIDTIFLRRSDLASNLGLAAIELAHEGTHLLDDKGRLSDPFIMQASAGITQLGGAATAAGREAQANAVFLLTMIKEARAFTFAGQVARELGVQLPSSDPTSLAAAGGNDGATYARVWQALLQSSYNPERRSAPVQNF